MRGRAGPLRDDGQEGSASVLVLALACLVALLGCVLVALGSVAVSRHRAASAADLGALAAAGRALQGQAQACAAAGVVVRQAGGELTRCVLVTDTAEVEARVAPPGPLGSLGAAQARARAGPAVLR